MSVMKKKAEYFIFFLLSVVSLVTGRGGVYRHRVVPITGLVWQGRPTPDGKGGC